MRTTAVGQLPLPRLGSWCAARCRRSGRVVNLRPLVHPALAPDGPARRLRRALHLRAAPGRLGADFPQDAPRSGAPRARAASEDPFPALVAHGAQERPAGVPRARAVRLGEVEPRAQARPGATTSSAAPRRRASCTRCWRSGATTSARSSAWASPSICRQFVAREPGRRRRGDRPQGARRPPPPPGARDARGVRPARQAHRAAHRRDAARPRAAADRSRRRAARRGKPLARRSSARPGGNLNAIAARLHPTVLAVVAPVLDWVFNRIYDGIEVDEAGLERALEAGAAARPSSSAPATRATSTTW